MLIQNDKISVIFLCLLAKLQLFKVIKLCCSAQAIEKFFRQLFNLKKACFFVLQFYDAAKARKKPLRKSQADRAIGIKQCFKHAR